MGDVIKGICAARGLWRRKTCRHFGPRIACGSARKRPQLGTPLLLAATALFLIPLLGGCQRQEKATPAAAPGSAVPAELHSGTLSAPALAPPARGSSPSCTAANSALRRASRHAAARPAAWCRCPAVPPCAMTRCICWWCFQARPISSRASRRRNCFRCAVQPCATLRGLRPRAPALRQVNEN
jgi:hypothetical protein